MKRERIVTCLVGGVLAFLLSFGGVGCMVSAFRLEVGGLWLLALACGLFSLVSAVFFQLKWGGTVILCLMVLASGFLWHSAQAMEQLRALLYRLSYIYNLAYGWGVLGDEGLQNAAVGYPLGVLGCLVAVTVTWTVCRRKSAVFSMLLALAPLISCVVVTDTVPEEGYLYLLLLGMLVLVLTNGLRRKSESQANALTFPAAAAAALALGLLFLAVPQESYVNPTVDLQKQILAWVEDVPLLWEQDSGHIQGGSGKSPEVDLRNLGPRVAHTYPVMDVVGTQSGTLYLREQDYNLYDGTGWTANTQRQEQFGGRDGFLEAVGTVKVNTTRGRDVTYIPWYPGEALTLTGGKLRNEDKKEYYEFTQLALPEGWRSMLDSRDLSSGLFSGGYSRDGGSDERYLVLPDATRERAEALLKSILRSEATNTEKADAIAAYVRGCAEYDQNTGKMPAGAEDFAIWFLEEGDTGYCVHFATAATVLLRAAGIPARYVTGYMTRTVQGQSVTVTADQAHAWAEYYEPQLGLWIVLESTPPDPAQEETIPATQPSTEPSDEPTEETEGSLPTEEEVTEAPPDRETESTLPERVEFVDTVYIKGGKWIWDVLKGLLALGLSAGAVILQRVLRLRLRQKRMRGGKANQRALARWREAELLYRRLGKSPPIELEKLAQKARFSQHTLTAEELRIFDSHLEQARNACREKPWYLRLVDRYVFAAY